MGEDTKEIPSPFITPDNNKVVITKADMEKIRVMLKAKAVLVIATDEETAGIPCIPEDCTGHWVVARSAGFHMQRIWSMADMLALDHIHNENCTNDNGSTPTE